MDRLPLAVEEAFKVLLESNPDYEKYLKMYSLYYDKTLNKSLRKHRLAQKTHDMLTTIIALAEALPSTPPFTCYRGFSPWLGKSPDVGDTLMDPAITSKSLFINVAVDFTDFESKCCIFEVEYTGETKQIPLYLVSECDDEGEVITFPGESFQVATETDRYRERHKFKCIQVGYQPVEYIVDSSIDQRCNQILSRIDFDIPHLVWFILTKNEDYIYSIDDSNCEDVENVPKQIEAVLLLGDYQAVFELDLSEIEQFTADPEAFAEYTYEQDGQYVTTSTYLNQLKYNNIDNNKIAQFYNAIYHRKVAMLKINGQDVTPPPRRRLDTL